MFKNWGGDFCANGIIDETLIGTPYVTRALNMRSVASCVTRPRWYRASQLMMSRFI